MSGCGRSEADCSDAIGAAYAAVHAAGVCHLFNETRHLYTRRPRPHPDLYEEAYLPFLDRPARRSDERVCLAGFTRAVSADDPDFDLAREGEATWLAACLDNARSVLLHDAAIAAQWPLGVRLDEGGARAS